MMQHLELSPFDGSTLVGFLASLGALKLLSLDDEDVQLSFEPDRCRARLYAARSDLKTALRDRLLDPGLAEHWRIVARSGRVVQHPSELAVEEVGALLEHRLAEPSLRERPNWRRFSVDVLSSLLADEPDEKGKAVSTQFRAVGGGQLQYFAQIADLFESLTADNVVATLDGPWRHDDRQGGLRLSPEEDRPYALRASDPAPEGARGERAANILALFGQTFFPTLPHGRGTTIGFEDKELRWPLWGDPAGPDTVAALLTLTFAESAETLRGYGVFRQMQARRFTRGQYRNFAPAAAVW